MLYQFAIHLFFRMLVFQTWAIAQAITNTLHSIVKLCTS
jgi:hypothetical protein